jgi:hypothetical protein
VGVEIRHIPVDTGRLAGFTCTVGPMPYTDRESGEARTDRESGLPLFQVGVTVRLVGEREAETWLVQVPGEPVGLVEDEKVRVYDLSVSHWSREGRSGLTYRASAITPVNAPAPASTAATGAGTTSAGAESGGRAASGRAAARD